MAIEVFTRKTFEAALPLHPETNQPLWKCEGCINGEYCYRVFFGNKHAEIFVRSSVNASGVSAGVGEDSIRVWLVAADAKKDRDGWLSPLCKKLQRWVTRQLNWRTNLSNLLLEQSRLGMAIHPCPQCGEVTRIYEIKSGSNIGKFATGCSKYDKANEQWVSHCFELLPAEFQPKPKKVTVKNPCPVCGIEMREVKINRGSNAGKMGLTCPAKDQNGNYMNHHFKVIDE